MSLDGVLARLLRGGWAARLAYALGLQGRLRARRHAFALARIPEPLHVAFAADLHAGPTTDPRLIARAIDAIVAWQPQLILLGGDFVAFDPEDVEPLVPQLRRLWAPLGTYAVLGNHDISAGRDHVTRALAAAGIERLTNRAVRLPPPYDAVCLAGLDDPIFGRPRAEPAFDDDEDCVRLVLMHAPDGLLTIGRRRFAVAFCGHTHGGQVALPDGTPITLPAGRLSRRFFRGVHTLRDGQKLLVTRGVGCSTIPIRLFAQPEVHLCTFSAGYP